MTDLLLVKLPEEAPIFPSPLGRGGDFDFTRPRDARGVTKRSSGEPVIWAFPTCGSTIFAGHTRRCC
jgi:hypothetical protein